MVIGALTAIVAATIGCVQEDIKKAIAYSTCSQLGYMFMAVGCGAYDAAMFHLTTHAFFKALLFLSAGSVIHSFSGEQKMSAMGGCWKTLPWTYTAMWIGSLALSGLPFFSGFYSKDAILHILSCTHLPIRGNIAFFLALLGVFLTSFYTFRVLILTFHGPTRTSNGRSLPA